MQRLAWQKIRLWVVGLFALGVVPAVWAGNTCRDRIYPTCTPHEWRTIRCCQVISNRFMFGECYCQRYTNSQGYNYFSGGIQTEGPSCVPQDDVCC